MLNSFKKNIAKLISKESKIIVAVSGGVDSAVLVDLIYKINFNFAIAHCNFKLRGLESDEDEKFVKSMSEKYNCKYFSTSFETETYSKSKKISIQMAARELRYDWFDKILTDHKFNFILTAHHADDQVETVLLNLIRGTGINGLTGIKPINKNIVRPLLIYSKDDIITYANKNGVFYREDNSNSSLKYKRNFIRNKVVPHLKFLNEGLIETFYKNITHFNEVSTLVTDLTLQIKNKVIAKSEKFTFIDLDKLKKAPHYKFFLFEILKEYDFTFTTDIVNCLKKESGKLFYSKTHILLKDRTKLVIKPKGERERNEYILNENDKSLKTPIPLAIRLLNKKNLHLAKNNNIALLDLEKLSFPLTIRKWQQGDWFYPLGMINKKKLSDFFVNKKLSIFAKENTWLLCSGNDIVWIMGLRIDERYKVSEKTQFIYELTLDKNE